MKLSFFILTLSLTRLPLAYGMDPNSKLLDAVSKFVVNTVVSKGKVKERYTTEDNLEKVQNLIINHNANVNAQDNFGHTPLHNAIERPRVAKFLIDSGADINAQDRHGQTSLHNAVQLDCATVAKLLIDAGANINAQDNYGETPLHKAPYNYTSSIKLLLDLGADINIQNANGQTPLDVAIAFGKSQVVKLITGYLDFSKQIKLNPTKELLTQALELGIVRLVTVALNAGIQPDLHDLAVVKQKYMQSSNKFDKDTYATIGRMLLQHLRLTGKLQSVKHKRNAIKKFYHKASNLIKPTHSNIADHIYGPISKSGIAQTGLPEDIIHAIASFMY